jgi:hypothetical protein
MKFLDHFWSITKIGNKFPSPFTNSYPYHWTRYSNFLQMILEWRIFETLNSFCLSISIKRSGIWNLLGIEDSLYGSRKENIGWVFIDGGNSRRNITSLICLTTEKGPRQWNSNLSHGRLVLRLWWSNHTLFPMLITWCAFQDLSILFFYRSWASRSLFFISLWILDNWIARSPAAEFSTLLKFN